MNHKSKYLNYKLHPLKPSPIESVRRHTESLKTILEAYISHLDLVLEELKKHDK